MGSGWLFGVLLAGVAPVVARLQGAGLHARPLVGGAERVVLHLRDVSFIDSSGLLALEVAHRTAAASGAALVLRSVSRPTWDLLSVTGLDSIFSIER